MLTLTPWVRRESVQAASRAWYKRLTSPVSLLLAIVPFLIAIALIFIFAKKIADWAGALSVCAAVIGFLFNSAVKLYAEMRDHSFNFLKDSRDDAKLIAAFATIGRFYDQNSVVDEARALDVLKLAVTGRDIDPEAREAKQLYESIKYVGNFFERMYVIQDWNGIFDRILYDYYKGVLDRYLTSMDPFIKVIRNVRPRPGSPFGDVPRPAALENVDKLHERWRAFAA